MHLVLRTHFFRQDKLLHFIYSFGIFGAASFFSLPPLISAGITFLVGLGKEVWDHYYGSGFCQYDLLANALGIAAALALCPGVSLFGLAG